MKPLTERQARRCETAKTPRCRCRCKGMLHGGQRVMPELLPEGDPHHFVVGKQKSFGSGLDLGPIGEVKQ
jgi:hypothetical protein